MVIKRCDDDGDFVITTSMMMMMMMINETFFGFTDKLVYNS